MSKVLVVEDSIVISKHLSKILEGVGLEVRSASSAKEGTQIVKEFLPELVLLDIMMEEQYSGIQFAQVVKEICGSIPIIFLTALTDNRTLEKIRKVGPYGYITKPFSEAQLVTNVQVAISKSQSDNELRQNFEYQRAIFNLIGNYLIVCNKDFEIVNYNDLLGELLGSELHELFARPLHEVVTVTTYEDYTSIEDVTALNREDYYSLEICESDGSGTFEMPITDFQVQDLNTESGSYHLISFKDATDSVRRRNLEQQLRLKNLSQLVHGQELERSRISAELHDNLSQILNSAMLAMKTDKGTYAVEMIEHALAETRRISENLMPSKLLDFSVERSIGSFLNKLREVVDYEIVFYTEDVPVIEDRMQKIHLFRIIQEVTSNATKYSQCSQLTIQLVGLNDCLLVSAEDDGVGFAKTRQLMKESHGMRNMEYRAELLGADLSVESEEGKGTFVSIKVPIKTREGHEYSIS